MIRNRAVWADTPTTSKKEKTNDDYDFRNCLPTTEPLCPARDRVPVQDRSRAARRELDTWTEPVEEETLIESWMPGGSARIITPELAFFAIVIGFGLVLIVGALLGIVEVGHE